MRDDDEEDDYVLFGTPLPELDDDTVVKKKAVQDLTVRDDKGRQRFHGAFTGGFSAGYFNTVGTKEGWEPKNFSSSRSNKASSSFHQNPEDFMDEEDFGEFGIAPKKIHTTSNFRDPSTSFAKKRAHVEGDEVIPGVPPLKDIIKPVTESVGIRILKQMGWRQGQGIGPRVKKKTEPGVKVYGCSLGPLISEDVNDPVMSEVTFAPDDSAEVPYTPKDDYHGIGYSGLSTQSVLSLPVDDAFSLSKTKSWLAKDKKKLTIRGQAFGVGAFEDDDEDIYTKDDMSQYDFSELMGGKNDHKKEKSRKDSRDKYSSVIEVLEGFTLASNPATARKYFAPPELPKNFDPMNKKSFLSSKQLPQSDTTKHTLNPNVRSILIGEKLFQKPENKIQKPSLQPRRSRFDVGPSEMQALTSVTVDSRLNQGPSFVPSHLSSPFQSSKFKPFDKDSDKQKRYEEFVKMGCNKAQLELLQPSSMTEWERQQELDEFMKAAILYQPLCKALESRFESKSHLGVEISLIVPKKVEPTETPAKKPVDDKPYRETFEWHPVALLCKRFNVPNPYPDSQHQGIPMTEKKKKPSLFDDLFMESSLTQKSTPSISAEEPSSSKSFEPVKIIEKKENTVTPPSEENNEKLISKAPDIQEIPKGTRPPIDLFKEIFQNSSSEDSSSEEDTDTAKNIDSDKTSVQSSIENGRIEKVQPELTLQASESKTTSLESKTVATERKGFGVFANLDLDALNKRTPSTHKALNKVIEENKLTKDLPPSDVTEERTTEKPPVSEASTMDDSEDVYYGPAPPPPGSVAVISNYAISSHKHSKHRHKQHKHKVKKKKKKKEKKKHSRKGSEKSSEESEEDVPSSLILAKLRELKELDRISKK